MQRKSTRGPKTQRTCNTSNEVIEEIEQVQNDQILIDKEVNNKSWLILLVKYLFIIIVILPWIISISVRVKQNDIFHKIQFFIEDSFSCPIRNNTCICDANITTTKKTDPEF